jgi:hypothetical protein
MTARSIQDRLLAGERLFLPAADWREVKNRGGSLYHDVRTAGRYLHCVRGVDDQGTEGIRVWVDEIPRRRPAGKGLFTDARPSE